MERAARSREADQREGCAWNVAPFPSAHPPTHPPTLDRFEKGGVKSRLASRSFARARALRFGSRDSLSPPTSAWHSGGKGLREKRRLREEGGGRRRRKERGKGRRGIGEVLFLETGQGRRVVGEESEGKGQSDDDDDSGRTMRERKSQAAPCPQNNTGGPTKSKTTRGGIGELGGGLPDSRRRRRRRHRHQTARESPRGEWTTGWTVGGRGKEGEAREPGLEGDRRR